MFEFIPMSWSDVKAHDMLTILCDGRTTYFRLTSVMPPFYADRAPTLVGRHVTKSGDLHRGRRQRWDTSITVALPDVVSVQRRDYRIYDVAVAEAQAWQELRDAAHAEADTEADERVLAADEREAAELEADGGWGQPEGMINSGLEVGDSVIMIGDGPRHFGRVLVISADGKLIKVEWPGSTGWDAVELLERHPMPSDRLYRAEQAAPIRKGDTVTRKGEPDGPRGVVGDIDTVTGVGVSSAMVSFSGLGMIRIALDSLSHAAPVADDTQTIVEQIATLRRELLNPGVVNGDLVRQVIVARLDMIAAHIQK